MVLTLTFFIGLALSVLKLLEIALSAKQQAYVQDWIETAVLHLSYISWSSSYEALRQRKIQVALGFITLLLAYAISTLLALFGIIRLHLDKGQAILIIVQAILLLTLFPLEVSWLTRGNSKFFAIKAASILMIPVALVLLASYTDFDVFLDNFPKWRLVVILPFDILIGICLYVSFYIGLAKLAKGVLLVFVKVLWRVVEYPKGAWAGVLFIATAALGICQIISAQKH